MAIKNWFNLNSKKNTQNFSLNGNETKWINALATVMSNGADKSDLSTMKFREALDYQKKWVTNSVGYSNDMTGIGGAWDVTQGAQVSEPGFLDYTFIDNVYRTNIFARKLIDIPVSDMTRKWREFQYDDPETVKKRNTLEKKFRVRENVKLATRYGDLYGGSALYIIVNDGKRQDEPLDIDSIKPGQFKKFQPVFLGQLYPQGIIELNPSSKQYGKSTTYIINNNSESQIHHSRLIIFNGVDLPLYAAISQMTFGDSRLLAILDILNACKEIYLNIANLICRANIDVIGMKDFDQAAASGVDGLLNKLDLQKQIAGNINKLIMDAEDSFTRNELQNTQSLSEILLTFFQMVASAANMPLTRFLGTSVGGFSSGDNEIIEYYESIAERQNGIRDQLETIDHIIEVIGFGKQLDIDYEFLSLHELSPLQKAQKETQDATRDATYLSNGVVTAAIVASQLRANGVYDGIDEEHINDLEQNEEDMSAQEDADFQELLKGLSNKPADAAGQKQNDPTKPNKQQKQQVKESTGKASGNKTAKNRRNSVRKGTR